MDLTDSQEMIDCKFKPGADAPVVSVQISLIDYEIMCKQTVEENFCDCDTSQLGISVNDKTLEDTLSQFFVTRTVTETVYLDDDGKLDLAKQSNVIAFIAGIFITVFVMSIIGLAICLYKRRQSDKTVQLARSLSHVD